MAGPKKGGIRWRPTSEQLMILEELFKGGMKTPTSLQVQKITTRLQEHGKVETKNVFYWFQNHKAREKQKIRRKIGLLGHQMLISHNNNNGVYYYTSNINHHPHQPHFASGFLPFFTPQVDLATRKGDLATRKDEQLAVDNVSLWAITWLPVNHHDNRPLKTLELFPTTTETATTATTTSTAAESDICISNRILISL